MSEATEVVELDPQQMLFDSGIAWELAAQMADPQDVLKRYGYEGNTAFALVSHPLFQSDLKKKLTEIKAGGWDFKQRAKHYASDTLTSLHSMVKDKKIKAADRIEAAKLLVKLGELEPKEAKGLVNEAFVLQIIGVGI